MKYAPDCPSAKRHDLNRQRAIQHKCAAVVIVHVKPPSCRSIKRARIQERRREQLDELKNAKACLMATVRVRYRVLARVNNLQGIEESALRCR
jgi:hypothetical protein